MRTKKVWIKERPAKSHKNPLKCKHAFVSVDSDSFPTCMKCGFDELELKDLHEIEIKRIAREVAKEYAERVTLEREKKALELEASRRKIIEEHEAELLRKDKLSKFCAHSHTLIDGRGKETCNDCGKYVKVATVMSKPLLIGRPATITPRPPGLGILSPPDPSKHFAPTFKIGDMVRFKDSRQIGEIQTIHPVSASRMGVVYTYEVRLENKETGEHFGTPICREDEIELWYGKSVKKPRKRLIANKTRKPKSRLVISDDEISFS